MSQSEEKNFSLDDFVGCIRSICQSHYEAEDILKRLAFHLIENKGFQKKDLVPIFNKYTYRLPGCYTCIKCCDQDIRETTICPGCKQGVHVDSSCLYEGRYCSKECLERVCTTKNCSNRRWPYDGLVCHECSSKTKQENTGL